MSRLTSFARRARRAVLARRRPLAAVAAAAAVAAGLQAAAPPPPARTPVIVAAHDLPAGAVVGPGDVRRVPFTPGTVPEGTLTAAHVVGRTTAAPLRAGEPVTDVRLVTGSVLAGYPGAVASPVRIGDAAAVRLLRPGDRVDVLAADPRTGRAELVAHDVPVIAVPRTSTTSGDLVSGALVVLAVSPDTARALAGAAVSSYLSVALLH